MENLKNYTAPNSMTITENIDAILLHLGINGVAIIEELPDRVRALDTLGELQKHIDTHPEHWMRDIYDPLHAGLITHSYRERYRPSMQICTHPISQINPNHPPETQYMEMDVDYSPPDNPLDFLRHSAEVGHNLITRNKTDENEAARLLAARFARETQSV